VADSHRSGLGRPAQSDGVYPEGDGRRRPLGIPVIVDGLAARVAARVGAGMGSPVRAEIVWVSGRTQLSGRVLAPSHRQRAEPGSAVGADADL